MGYISFESFLQSPEMSPRLIIVEIAEGDHTYKAYPTKADLENYVAQQLGTDYGETR